MPQDQRHVSLFAITASRLVPSYRTTNVVVTNLHLATQMLQLHSVEQLKPSIADSVEHAGNMQSFVLLSY